MSKPAAEGGGLNAFAALLDALAYEPRRNGKLALLTRYFRETPDPERGLALAAMTGALTFQNAKPGLIRALMAERTDPVLFALSYDYVGDLSETVALLWPPPDDGAGMGHNRPPLLLSEVVEGLASMHKGDLPRRLASWLDALDETGRWALLKLITGALRIGVSARLAKTAVAALGTLAPDDIEEVWHGLLPPYAGLFAWAEGHGPRPESDDPAPFRPPMLAHALEDTDFSKLDPAEHAAEWKWDGIRIQIAAGTDMAGRRVVRLYSRTGEDISHAFPDVAARIGFDGAIDGELLIVREGRVQSFNVLQQRLNRKVVSAKLMDEFPAHVRAYDLLVEGGDDVRPLPFQQRRARLERFIARHAAPGLDISDLIPFADWEALAAARANPALAGAGADADAVEGCMVKRLDSPYLPGRPKGHWYKWKRDPRLIDAVLMYAQRGHGKRSSFYSDFTFGVWRGDDELVPVGKAYFGFTDEELAALDKHVRKHTTNRFGPVREVSHGPDDGLVLEVAFEGIGRSPRHKSGVAMRFPRISRIRWDKPAREADRLETLEALIDAAARAVGTDETGEAGGP
jgi:DNA ligase-1